VTGQDLRLVNLRAHRSSETRGVGWTHAAFIEAVCAWTGAAADFRLGSSDVSFRPGRLPTDLLKIDLDDPDRTFASYPVEVSRDYSGASDRFPQNIDNRDGRGIRGHAASMFLLGLLPLLAVAGSAARIEVAGGTETPGGPFADAVCDVLYPAARACFGAEVAAGVLARGLMGRGGGYAFAANDVVRPRASRADRHVCRVYLFGDSTYRRQRAAQMRRELADAGDLLNISFDVEIHDVPCAQNATQLLVLLADATAGEFARDVSMCHEEGVDWTATRIAARVGPELASLGVVSRFIAEQLLPVAAATGSAYEFSTERITPHLEASIVLLRAIVGASITVKNSDAGCRVKLRGRECN
jgi:RNA 3'-terminal phosphate cyclase